MANFRKPSSSFTGSVIVSIGTPLIHSLFKYQEIGMQQIEKQPKQLNFHKWSLTNT